MIVIHQDCACFLLWQYLVGFEPATSESLVRGVNHSATWTKSDARQKLLAVFCCIQSITASAFCLPILSFHLFLVRSGACAYFFLVFFSFQWSSRPVTTLVMYSGKVGLVLCNNIWRGKSDRLFILVSLWWWLDVIVIHQDCAGKFALTVADSNPRP